MASAFGYERRPAGIRGPGDRFDAAHLRAIGQPRTVIDVGVGSGTPALYEAFRGAHFVLIEPLEEYRGAIDGILSEVDGRAIFRAVGDREGTVDLHVDREDPRLSSLFERTPLTRSPTHRVERRQVEMSTLDAVLAPLDSLETPILLKLDTEGNELAALRGARSLLERASTVICEVSIARRFDGGYQFEELSGLLGERGFGLFSILYVAHAPGERRPRFADVVFTKIGS